MLKHLLKVICTYITKSDMHKYNYALGMGGGAFSVRYDHMEVIINTYLAKLWLYKNNCLQLALTKCVAIYKTKIL